MNSEQTVSTEADTPAGEVSPAEDVAAAAQDVKAAAAQDVKAAAAQDVKAAVAQDVEAAVAQDVEAASAEDVAAAPAAAEDSWAHFAPEPERTPGRVATVARRVGRILGHEWTVVGVGALVLAMAMHWRSVVYPGTTIPADLGDPLLQSWQMSWAGHVLTTNPLQLWNANTFYPDDLSFAFSDTLLGYLPASLIGHGTVATLVRYNIMFVLLQVLAFVGPYALVRQLGAGRTGAALAGAAFGYAPWRWAQAGHMHVMSDGGLALTLAMLARGYGYSLTDGFRADRVRPGWIFAGWCMAAWQISLGFGIGLPFAYLLGGAALVVGIRWLLRARRGQPVPGRRALLANVFGIPVFGAVSAFMAWPYLEVAKLHPEAVRTSGDLHTFSPMLRAFVTAPAQSLLWGPAHAAARATMAAPAETTLLPGFFLLGLTVAGLFFSIWSRRTRLWLLGGTVGSLILAMGTQFFGGYATYLPLFWWAPGWSGLRTPGRLFVWTTLGMAILAAGAVAALVRRADEFTVERVPARPSLLMRLATILPVLLVLAEGLNTIDHPVVPPTPAGFATAAGPLFVLPSDSSSDFLPMYWSTAQFPKIVNGASGFNPKEQLKARDVARSFPDRNSVAYFQRIGVRSVVVVKAKAGKAYPRAVAPDRYADGLGIQWREYPDIIVYSLS
jgi:hypothetical protein